MFPEIINKGESLSRNPIDVVGGKGYNLLKLAELPKYRDFVPEFSIIPVGVECTAPQLEELFESLPKPLAVRSSSPYEDLSGLSFAGRFKTILGIQDFYSFCKAIDAVLESANADQVKGYAQQHGVSIDERMAVIVQEMIDPSYSGVCYSTINPDKPRTIVEFVYGLSGEMMSGDKQGNIASFDQDLCLTMEHGYKTPGLKEIAKVAKDLEGIFNQRLDVEFAVSGRDLLYILQARPITEPDWEDTQIPDVDDSRVLLRADIVRGAGSFTGPVFVFRSPEEMERYAAVNNKQPMIEMHEQWRALKNFNNENKNGYCLLADNLEAHEILARDGKLSNLKAMITVAYASRFSHPAKIISETGAFYLGVLGRSDLLDSVATGDTITVMGDQSKGLVYDLIKPPVKRFRIDLEDLPVIEHQIAMGMFLPHYEEIDDRLFLDKAGTVGVNFWDYNEENGIPTDVFYSLVDRNGNVLDKGEYRHNRVIYRHPTFPSLLNDLLTQAKEKNEKREG